MTGIPIFCGSDLISMQRTIVSNSASKRGIRMGFLANLESASSRRVFTETDGIRLLPNRPRHLPKELDLGRFMFARHVRYRKRAPRPSL
ncbi:hypothetical protein AVEN_234670-1 [Araneus ventricosus]|uniref:Uncharacterized protein n=1 Tax=Araneus ventricosus TaxID=182803 RepID=A0A4Y2CZD1_ARAVE|nr:hypothetical protein AVEN_234670-1 [Araneus ventricosus]